MEIPQSHIKAVTRQKDRELRLETMETRSYLKHNWLVRLCYRIQYLTYLMSWRLAKQFVAIHIKRTIIWTCKIPIRINNLFRGEKYKEVPNNNVIGYLMHKWSNVGHYLRPKNADAVNPENKHPAVEAGNRWHDQMHREMGKKGGCCNGAGNVASAPIKDK